jgi:lathosterol oxidase
MDSPLTLQAFLVPAGTLFAFFIARTVVVCGGFMLALRTGWARARRTYRKAFGEGQLRAELPAGVRNLLLDAALVTAAVRFGVFQFVDFSPGVFALTFLLLFCWYEVWFYASHRALHSRPLYRFHAQHHVAKVVHPLTSLSFSIVERLTLQVGAIAFIAIVSRVLPMTRGGAMAYFTFNYLLNVWGHSNLEVMAPGFHRTLAGRLFISASFHAMHHARYDGHYGLFTQVLDRALGTRWDDVDEVQSRAARGEGLEQLGERLAARAPRG